MVEVSLTIGKLDASLALLLTKDHHLIEFPTILLPNGVKAGSIVKIKCDQDLTSEQEEAIHFQKIQDEILNTFATNLPKKPELRVKNVTQTSCVLEWDQLDLGTASLKNLILFKDGKKLGSIPSPLTNKTSKLSGLPIDKSFKFQLRLDTTAGTYLSQEIEVNTHKMTDLSGITVCLGDFSANDPFTKEDIEKTLKTMGAKYPPQQQVMVDTTHYLCTRENKQNPEYIKANEMNIPIIRPEWLKACERERRIVGVRDFYVKDCVLPDIFAKNYWKDSSKQQVEQKDGELPAVPVVKQPEETNAGEQPPVQVNIAITETRSESVPSIEISQHDEKAIEDKVDAQEENIDDGFEKSKVENETGQEEVANEDVKIEEPSAEDQSLVKESSEGPEATSTEINVEIGTTEPEKVSGEEELKEVDLDKLDDTPASKVEIEQIPEPEEFEQVALEEPEPAVAENKAEIEETPAIVESDATEKPATEEHADEDEGQEEDDEEDNNKVDPTTASPSASQDKKKKKEKKNKKK